MDWQSYLAESNKVEFADPKSHAKFMSLSDALTKAFAVSYGDLRYKNVAKRIIRERTQSIAIAKGYPAWSFRFQCLMTGRKSKFIKVDDYHLFGITKADADTGGNFTEYEQLTDRLKPVREKLASQLSALYKSAFSTVCIGDWWRRYSEYLASEQWAEMRERVLARDHYRCQITAREDALQVHHLTYANVGNEHIADLVTLCKDAHRIVHDASHHQHKEYTSAISRYVEVMVVQNG